VTLHSIPTPQIGEPKVFERARSLKPSVGISKGKRRLMRRKMIGRQRDFPQLPELARPTLTIMTVLSTRTLTRKRILRNPKMITPGKSLNLTAKILRMMRILMILQMPFLISIIMQIVYALTLGFQQLK
jgi:hypothetical protein